MYIEREIQKTLQSYMKQFKVVLVTGARQAGKTTMLKHVLGESFSYVTLDDLNELNNALNSPSTFVTNSTLPVFIDEVQLAPSLFRQIKLIVDRCEDEGVVVLSGSQSFNLMQGVSESLAGRVGVMELSSFSLREVTGNLSCEAYVPQRIERKSTTSKKEDFDVWSHICRGSMPRLQEEGVDRDVFYSSYVRTYLERDVRQLVNLKDETKFYNFLIAMAARTGQLLNASDIADTAGVSVKTVQEWTSVLEASGIIHILQPFWANSDKRLSKTPKAFFLDTGLACYLTGWDTAKQLQRGAMNGHIFETFVVSEILKSHKNAGKDLRNIFFYRDQQKREIDLVIKSGHCLHPVEVKLSGNVGNDAIKNFDVLTQFKDYEVGFGHVVCQTETPYFINENVQAVSPFDI